MRAGLVLESSIRAVSESGSQSPLVNTSDGVPEPESPQYLPVPLWITILGRGSKDTRVGRSRVKLDESRGFDLTINVPPGSCTDWLALGHRSM